ncbi:unnamed protein product [Prunus armeniaca]|uniref:MADS-box domain-containing protein n=1 Tax=Prunus armeniaca TaxID=36596 RepID=A0A6J5TYY8_PRUAR|nr:unnamed protein product [Prunus armeniaca]
MTRKKIDLAYIKNDAARKTTFKKRKSGLMKKVGELSILCGTDACAVIYGQHQANPDVSPCPDGALRTITRFKQMSKMERSRNILNQESFLRQTILKADEKLKKQMNDNQEKEMMIQAIYGSLPADWLQKLSHVDLNDLWLSVEKNIEAIAEMMTSMEKP